jgi:pyridoxamine 5'-phosphate oxidase
MIIGEHNEYEHSVLSEGDLDSDPVVQLEHWLDVASQDERVTEANAMTIATVGDNGAPSARVVLLRNITDGDLVFYTNYKSRKGRELENNAQIAAVFLWAALQRQVRVEGTVTKVSTSTSDEYFSDRPIKSQIGAVVSNQSEVIANRKVLEDAVDELQKQIEHGHRLVRPEFWGGYAIRPTMFEFWQGRRSRLHDRLRYRLIDGQWTIDRLSP